MKKLLFRMTSTLLVLLLLVSVWGCSTKPKDPVESTVQPTTEQPPVTETKPPMSDEELIEMVEMAEEALRNVPKGLSETELFQYFKDRAYIVHRNFSVVSGENLWNDFLEKQLRGEICTVFIVSFYEWNGKLILSGTDVLHFDGSNYKHYYCDGYNSTPTDRHFVQKFQYLLDFEGEEQDKFGTYSFHKYYLVNDQNLTYAEIQENNWKALTQIVEFVYTPVVQFRTYEQ